MNRDIQASYSSTVLRTILGMCVLAVLIIGVAAGAEWHVYPGAGTPIQAAIGDAGPGDTIYVHAGMYVENVDVNKRVALIGDGADVVTVRAADAEDHVFEVTADWVNMSGFTVKGETESYNAGICLANGVNRCSISNNAVSNNWYGIHLYFSSNNTITNNICSNSSRGIWILSSSNNNIIKNNTCSNNSHGGIEVWSSTNNTIINHNFEHCSFFIFGSSIKHYASQTIENNTVNGKTIYFYRNTQDIIVPEDAGQVILANCSNITVKNINASSASVGIELAYANKSVVENNTCSNHEYGIFLSFSSNNILTNNTCNSNNDHGVCLYWSSNNTPYHNNLINNTQNTYDEYTNQWDSGTEGNYYSDYTGTDNNTDGIGEDPYSIPGGGGSVDNYPLMQPWTGGTPQKGNLNGDDQITPADAAIALSIAAGGAHNLAADMSGDGKVTSLDALMILQAAGDTIDL